MNFGEDIILPPTAAWRPGWHIAPSSWSDSTLRACTPAYVLQTDEGEIAIQGETEWMLKTAVPASMKGFSLYLLSCGFHIQGEKHETESEHSFVLCPEPDVIWGCSTFSPAAVLMSKQCTFDSAHNIYKLETESGNILLELQEQNNETVFCLVRSTLAWPALFQKTEYYFEQEIHSALEKQYRHRSLFWMQQPSLSPTAKSLHFAAEDLASQLHPPTAIIPHRWSPLRSNADIFDINEVFPLAIAWCDLDPVVAQDLVLSALSTQQDDGRIPETIDAIGGEISDLPCLPLLSQAVRTAFSANQDQAFAAECIPKLETYLLWAAQYYRNEDYSVFQWPDRRHAFIQESYEPTAITADLYSFLLCEIEAFQALCEDIEYTPANQRLIEQMYDDLSAGLTTKLWNNKAHCFLDKSFSGPDAERVTFSALCPLLWNSLQPALRKPTLYKAMAIDEGRNFTGIPAWEGWKDDPSPPPVLAFHQLLFLESLRRCRAEEQMHRVSSRLRQQLDAIWNEKGCFPDELTGLSDTDSTEECSSVATALRITLSNDLQTKRHRGQYSPLIKWMDDHRVSISIISAGSIIILVMLISFMYQQKKALLPGAAKALTGLARQKYRDGEYSDVIDIYSEFVEKIGPNEIAAFNLGNAFYKKNEFSEAEVHYRLALKKEEIRPIVLMNLALSLQKQGKMKEARTCYQEILENCPPELHEIQKRASLALDLLAGGKIQ